MWVFKNTGILRRSASVPFGYQHHISFISRRMFFYLPLVPNFFIYLLTDVYSIIDNHHSLTFIQILMFIQSLVFIHSLIFIHPLMSIHSLSLIRFQVNHFDSCPFNVSFLLIHFSLFVLNHSL